MSEATGLFRKTLDEITVRADADAVYHATARIERWPEFLPHYRWVTILRDIAGSREVEMAARWGLNPVKWQAIQTVAPGERRVNYRHTGGATRGMGVEWSIQPEGDAVRVTTVRHLSLQVPLVRNAVTGSGPATPVGTVKEAFWKALISALHG